MFLDPDNGLEVSSMSSTNANKYVRYSEARGLLDRMDAPSVLAIYQHLPRQSRKLFFQRLKRKLIRKLGVGNIICISDNTIAFLVLTKNARRQGDLRTILVPYSYNLSLQVPIS